MNASFLSNRKILAIAVLTLGGAARAPAQEPDPGEGDEEKGRPANVEYEPLVKPLEIKYIAPKEGTEKQTISVKLEPAPELPRGAKLTLELEQFNFPLEPPELYEITLDGPGGKEVSVLWNLKEKRMTGKYHLRTHLYLAKQSAVVQRAVKANPKRFPPMHEPWSSFFLDFPINIGSSQEESEETKEACAAYDNMVVRGIELMNEFIEKADAIKAGEELVKDGKLDAKGYEDFLVDWRERQAAYQTDIVKFSEDAISMVMKRPQAIRDLMDFGRMISKRSTLVQTEVTEQYKVAEIKPKSPRSFDARYRQRVDLEALKDRIERIHKDLDCPEEPAAGDADAEAGAEAEAEAEKPGDEENPPEEKPEEKPEERPEEKPGQE